MSKIIVNCETNEVEIRELNADELAQQAKDELESLEFDKKQQQIKTAKAALLNRLGITEAEAKLLLS